MSYDWSGARRRRTLAVTVSVALMLAALAATIAVSVAGTIF
ncbi:hypothetical protein LPJGGPFB_02541 [Ensifer adhaerens]|nr:hypothetical protein [Ensifer adhaerens]